MRDTTISRAQFRVLVAIRTCNLLRDAIDRNGGMYSGGLVPNLTSVTDVLSIPYNMLVEQVKLAPQYFGDLMLAE